MKIDTKNHVFTLPNGVRCHYIHAPEMNTVKVSVVVHSGGLHDRLFMPGSTQYGIAHFVEHMTMNSTLLKNKLRIMQETASKGIQANAYTSHDHTCYWMHGPSVHLAYMLQQLSEYITQSAYKENDIATERTTILAEIGMRNDYNECRFYDSAVMHMYRKTNANQPIIGTEESVNSITREHLLHYVDKYHVGGNIEVVVIGDCFSTSWLEVEIGRWFGDVRPGSRAEDIDMSLGYIDDKDDLKIVVPSASNAIIGYLYKSKLGHLDDLREEIAVDAVLDTFGGTNTSRMYVELREKLGLCYSCGLYKEPFHNNMGIITEVSCNPKDVDQVRSLLRHMADELYDAGITHEELEKYKNHEVNILYDISDNITKLTSLYLRDCIIEGRSWDTPKDMMDIISSLDLDYVNSRVKQIFERCDSYIELNNK